MGVKVRLQSSGMSPFLTKHPRAAAHAKDLLVIYSQGVVHRNEIDWKLLPAECSSFSHLSLNTYSFYFLTLREYYPSVAAGMIYDAKATCRWKIPYVPMGSWNCELRRQFAPGPRSRTRLSLIYRLPIRCVCGERWLARLCSSPLALSMGVPQGSILGPDLFPVLFADKVTLTTILSHREMWAESSSTEYMRGVEENAPTRFLRRRHFSAELKHIRKVFIP